MLVDLERYVGLTNASSLQCIKYATVLRRWCGAVTRSILCGKDCDSSYRRSTDFSKTPVGHLKILVARSVT